MTDHGWGGDDTTVMAQPRNNRRGLVAFLPALGLLAALLTAIAVSGGDNGDGQDRDERAAASTTTTDDDDAPDDAGEDGSGEETTADGSDGSDDGGSPTQDHPLLRGSFVHPES